MKGFPPKLILVAVDLSPAALAAADAAKALALRWAASLELVHVRQPVMVAAGMAPDAAALPIPVQDDEYELRMERRLRAAAAGFPAERVSVRVLDGWPARELLERARDDAAGLIVMGTHGNAGLERFMLGSVAESVVRGAGVPVMTVRASAA
ncbi:MAG: universal stress protein, partial [Elusimicrobia bacterium]|nr:universal stress protein [Elusimicrobiota bacterium]